jgi:integrase/recombinase XerD
MSEHSPVLYRLAQLMPQNEGERHKLDYEFFYNFASPHTRDSYRRDILQFFKFLNLKFPQLDDVAALDRAYVVAYRNHLEESAYAPKSVARKLSSLTSYFDFLVEKKIFPFNPCQGVKRPRQEVVTPTADLSDTQVETLLATLQEETPSAPMHRAVIYLLFSTGIRRAELINLKLKDVKKSQDHTFITVRAKGGKYLDKVLHPACLEMVKSYLEWMEAAGRALEADDYLLQPTRNPLNPGELNKPINPKTIEYIVKSWCKRAGIFERISPHSARATYIGSALEAGVDIYRVGRDVGHASVATTQMYDKRRKQMKESPAYNLGYFKQKAG